MFISTTNQIVLFIFYAIYIIQNCPVITRGRVLNGNLYAQRLQKLIYLHLPTDCFMKISFQSWGPHTEPHRLERNLYETVCRLMQIN